MNKEELIKLMEERIKSEYLKHKDLDWSKIASKKIFSTLIEIGILKEEDLDKEKDKPKNKEGIEISEIIKDLDIKVMYCRSGSGLMSYIYSFLQIGGVAGQSYDDVASEQIWDGDYKKGETVVDCRGIKCRRISKDELREIINNHSKK